MFPDPLFIDPEDNYILVASSSVESGEKLDMKKLEIVGKSSLNLQANAKFVGLLKIYITAIDNVDHKASTYFKVKVTDCRSEICDACNGPNIYD